MNIETVAKTLTIVTFVTLCWVAHRALQPRVDCVSSSYLSFVLVDQERVYNCGFESRLSLKSVFAPLNFSTLSKVRAMESLEPLEPFLPVKGPKVAVEVVNAGEDGSGGQFFELGKGYVRLGVERLKSPAWARRALIMGVLNSEMPHAFSGPFELEVIADFLTLTLFPSSAWAHAPVRDLRFSTASKTSGFGPVLAVALAKVYQSSPMKQKIAALKRLRSAEALPLVFEPLDTAGPSLAAWFEKSLRDLAATLGLTDELSIRQALKTMEVEAPTKWELTVDVTRTPAWKEIVEQLKTRGQFRPKERVLVFTPEGTMALPSGLPVDWEPSEISSQKHVMIACGWPASGDDDVVHIQARHIYAEQSCGKLTRPFWD